MINKKVVKSYISLFILILITVVPIFILYIDLPFTQSLYPWPTLFYTLGKITGLVGLSSFAFALLLSARFVWLDKLFYGLPKVINIHRWLGTISFTLIILHPLFLAARLLPASNQAPWSIFTLWSQTAYLYGYISILIFIFPNSSLRADALSLSLYINRDTPLIVEMPSQYEASATSGGKRSGQSVASNSNDLSSRFLTSTLFLDKMTSLPTILRTSIIFLSA
jgi:hypothetical protein